MSLPWQQWKNTPESIFKKKKEEKKKVGGVKIFKDREKENSFRKKPKTTTVSLKQNKIPVGTDKSVNIQSKLTPVEAYYWILCTLRTFLFSFLLWTPRQWKLLCYYIHRHTQNIQKYYYFKLLRIGQFSYLHAMTLRALHWNKQEVKRHFFLISQKYTKIYI